jgi:hypothetical protein
MHVNQPLISNMPKKLGIRVYSANARGAMLIKYHIFASSILASTRCFILGSTEVADGNAPPDA